MLAKRRQDRTDVQIGRCNRDFIFADDFLDLKHAGQVTQSDLATLGPRLTGKLPLVVASQVVQRHSKKFKGPVFLKVRAKDRDQESLGLFEPVQG